MPHLSYWPGSVRAEARRPRATREACYLRSPSARHGVIAARPLDACCARLASRAHTARAALAEGLAHQVAEQAAVVVLFALAAARRHGAVAGLVAHIAILLVDEMGVVRVLDHQPVAAQLVLEDLVLGAGHAAHAQVLLEHQTLHHDELLLVDRHDEHAVLLVRADPLVDDLADRAVLDLDFLALRLDL